MQDERLARGFWRTVMEDGNHEAHEYEAFSYRVKLLKRNARSAITLSMEARPVR